MSLPVRGEWIEMSWQKGRRPHPGSLPVRGEWIEMPCLALFILLDFGLSTCNSVKKRWLFCKKSRIYGDINIVIITKFYYNGLYKQAH